MRRVRESAGSTLADLVTALSPQLRVSDGAGLDAVFSGASFFEESMLAENAQLTGQVVLAPGQSGGRIASLAQALAAAGAAALIARGADSIGADSADPEPPAAADAARADRAAADPPSGNIAITALPGLELAVIELAPTGDWAQVYTTAQSLALPQVSSFVGSASMGDLFGAANAFAAIAYAAVSFVDDTGTILAYSTHQDQPIDDVRRQSTLSLREQTPIATDADYRAVTKAPGSVYFDPDPGQYGRVARTMRYAGEILGTVWVVQVDPAGAAATKELLDSVTPILTQHMLRARNEELDGGQRKRSLLRAVLENSSGAPVAYAQLALPPGRPLVVLSFGVQGNSDSHSSFGLRRLLQLVRGNASASFPFYECALFENRVVIVVSGSTEKHISSFAESVCRADATIAAGIGSVASGRGEVPRSHHESELVMTTLLAEAHGSAPARVTIAATRFSWFTAIRDRIALRQVAGAVRELSINAGDTLDVLTAYDREHGTDLVATMRVYLDCGSVRDAAEALHVHQNTLRYRLATVTEQLDINLGDPATRLWLWLRLTAAGVAG